MLARARENHEVARRTFRSRNPRSNVGSNTPGLLIDDSLAIIARDLTDPKLSHARGVIALQSKWNQFVILGLILAIVFAKELNQSHRDGSDLKLVLSRTIWPPDSTILALTRLNTSMSARLNR